VSLFGKSEGLSVWLKKLQARDYGSREELQNLLAWVAAEPNVAAQKVMFMLSDPEASVRSTAAQIVARDKGSKTVVEHLIQEMVGKHPQIRAELANLVAHIDPERAEQRMGTMAHSSRLQEREVGFDLLAALPNFKEQIPVLKAGLKDPEDSIRQRAIRILGRGKDNPTIFLILRDQIHSDDPMIRKIVIQSLSDSTNPGVIDVFFQRLPHEEEHERELMVRCLSRLARTTGARIEDQVVGVLADENPEVREAAVKLLCEMPNQKTVLRTFLLHLRGLASWLRDRCIDSISSMGQDLVGPMVELMDDPDEDIKVSAMHLVSKARDPRVIPAVRKIFQSQSDWWVRVMAADVLARFPERQVMDTLAARLHDPDLRYGVIHALGQMNVPFVIPHLLSCIEDPQRGIRMAVLDSLRRQTDPMVVHAIFERAVKDPEDSVQEKALVILENMGNAAHEYVQRVEAIRREQRRLLHETPDLTHGLQMENEELNPKVA